MNCEEERQDVGVFLIIAVLGACVVKYIDIAARQELREEIQSLNERVEEISHALDRLQEQLGDKEGEEKF